MIQESVVTVKFPVKLDDISPFVETMEMFRDACNYVSELVSYLGNDDNPATPSAEEIHKLVYHDIRYGSFRLKSQMAESVCRQVSSNYATFVKQIEESKREVERWEKRKAQAEAEGRYYGKRKPKVIKWHAIEYHKPFCRMTYNRDWSVLKDGRFSINTLGDRIRCNIDWKGHEQYKGRKYGEMTLALDKRKLYACVAVKVEVDVPDVKDINLDKVKVVGVDLGQRNLYVAYDGENTVFCDGGPVKNKRVHAVEKRSELQSKGTKSSKRRLVSLAKSENRYVEEVNHILTKALLQLVKRGNVLILEDLSGLNKRIWVRKGDRYLHYSWSYSSIRQKLEYKAREMGVTVIFVKPDDTSATCPVCGTVKASNRNRRKHEYKCNCGYRGNDDRTAAMNIRQRGIDEIRRLQLQSAKGSARKRRGCVLGPES